MGEHLRRRVQNRGFRGSSQTVGKDQEIHQNDLRSYGESFQVINQNQYLHLILVFAQLNYCLYILCIHLFRYSKTMGYFAELPKGAGYPKKLCFKFGPKAHNWLPFPNTEAPLNLVLKPKIESRRKPTEKRSNESILEKSSGFMRRMSELNTEQMSRKAGRKSVGQERALMGMTKDTHRYGMDLGSAESIYRFQSGSDGTPFPPDRQLEMTYNIPSFIEKSEELSADILDGPKQKDLFFRERSRRASMEETVHETDSLLLLARASTAESSATSPRSSSAEKQPSFDSPEHNQK